jgi:hypothetical protein
VIEAEPDLAEFEPPPTRPVSRVLELLFVLACCLVVLAALAPELLVTDSMPLGTDLVGHAVVSWFDSHNLLGFLPGSWSTDAFNGFPVNQLYPWLPSWLIGVLSLVMPLSIAIKVGVAIPLVLMPWAAWRAGTWAGLPQPIAAMLAAGTLPYLFDTSCGSCGGTINASINGEYSFAWAMLFAVLALGAVDRLARDGRGGLLAAVLVTATAFSHPLPTLWLLVGIATVAIGREVWARRDTLVQFGIAAAIAALMSAMWWLPFAAYQDWMPDNPLVRSGDTLTWLAPASRPWEIAFTLLALLGLVWAVRQRAWLLLAYAIGAGVALAAFFRFTEGGPFYSIRLLPFWQFGRWALAAVGFAWTVQVVVRRVRSDRSAPVDPRISPVAWLLPVIVILGSTWGWWGVTQAATVSSPGVAEVLGQKVEVTTASAGVRTTFAGFAARPDYPQLQAVQQLLRGVADRYGCGTLMWDSGDLTQDSGPVFGDPQVFWQSSIWTDGCIPAADGVLVDSSMTAPGMLQTKSLVSQSVEPLLANRKLFALNLDEGVPRMRTLGIRYYLTQGGEPAAQAAKNSLLTKVAQAGPWEVWQIDKGVPAASLPALPAVFEPRLTDADWEGVSNLYFTRDTYTDMPLAQDGRPGWPRASLDRLPDPSKVEPAGVSNIRVDQGRITFDVENVGSPVVVRVSDFPGWSVTGADGPFRATPNYLVVVPTSTTVTLSKGRTTVDWLASAAGVLGLALLVGYGLYRRLENDDADGDQSSDGQAMVDEHDPAAAGLEDPATEVALGEGSAQSADLEADAAETDAARSTGSSD